MATKKASKKKTTPEKMNVINFLDRTEQKHDKYSRAYILSRYKSTRPHTLAEWEELIKKDGLYKEE